MRTKTMLLPLLALAACKTDPEDPGTPVTDDSAPVAGSAQLRLLHLSPDAPNVDVYLGGDKVATDLAFGQGTAYLELPAGDYEVTITATGDTEPVLWLPAVEVAEGAVLSAVARGNASSLTLDLLSDDAEGLDGANIRARVAHHAPAVGAVDVWALLESGPVQLLDDVGFGAAAVLDDLPSAAYSVALDVDEDAKPDLVFDLPELPGGTFANIHAVNDKDGAVFLLAHLPDGTVARVDPAPAPARVRVAHLSPDAPAVDVWVNGAVALEGVSFAQGSPYLEVPAGPTDIAVTPAGSGPESAVLVVEDLALAPGSATSAAAIGNLESIEAFAATDSVEGLASTDIRIRVTHAAPAVGSVDVWAVSESPVRLLDDVPFGASAVLPDLAAGAYTVALDVDNDAVGDVIFALPELAGGTLVNAYAVNDAEGPFLLAQLPDGALVRIDPTPTEK